MNTKNVRVSEAWINSDERAWSERPGEKAEVQNEMHGDHDTDWLIIFDDKDNELRRFRADALLSIMWVEPSK